jgi:hypothetical protein
VSTAVSRLNPEELNRAVEVITNAVYRERALRLQYYEEASQEHSKGNQNYCLSVVEDYREDYEDAERAMSVLRQVFSPFENKTSYGTIAGGGNKL